MRLISIKQTTHGTPGSIYKLLSIALNSLLCKRILYFLESQDIGA